MVFETARQAQSDAMAFPDFDALAFVKEVVSLCRGMCMGLAYMHSQDVAHFDIKPPNVLVSHQRPPTPPMAIIADVGLAKGLDPTTKTVTRGRCGTPGFIAPELVSAGNSPATVSAAVDVWSFGVCLAMMLSLERKSCRLWGDGAPDHRSARCAWLDEKAKSGAVPRIEELVMSFPATEPGSVMSTGEAKGEDDAERARRSGILTAMRSVGGGELDLIEVAERCLAFDASTRPSFDDLIKLLTTSSAPPSRK